MDKTIAEMEELLVDAEDIVSRGENPYSRMTFVEGVAETMRWVMGYQEERPIEETTDV